MVLSCSLLIVITLLYFAMPGGRHSGGSLICLTIRIRSCYQLSVAQCLFLMNFANDQRTLLHRVCSRLPVLSRYSVGYGKYDSRLGANALYCCNHFDWSHDLLMLNLVDLNNSFFYKWHKNNLNDTELNIA
jgi:hypothetical protein